MTKKPHLTSLGWKRSAIILVFSGLLAFLVFKMFIETEGRSGMLEKGTIAADFRLPSLKTRQFVSLKSFRGKPVVLNFWATYCGPCRREMPALEALYQDFKSDGLVILAINTDPATKDRRAKVRSFIDQAKISFPVLLDYYVAFKRYGGERIPYTVLIDRQGKIVNDFEGMRSKSFFRKEFQRLISSN